MSRRVSKPRASPRSRAVYREDYVEQVDSPRGSVLREEHIERTGRGSSVRKTVVREEAGAPPMDVLGWPQFDQLAMWVAVIATVVALVAFAFLLWFTQQANAKDERFYTQIPTSFLFCSNVGGAVLAMIFGFLAWGLVAREFTARRDMGLHLAVFIFGLATLAMLIVGAVSVGVFLWSRSTQAPPAGTSAFPVMWDHRAAFWLAVSASILLVIALIALVLTTYKKTW